eukprot:459079-Amphidinium_carterae.1
MPSKASKQQRKQDEGKTVASWNCPSCKCQENWATRRICRGCGAERPKGQKAGKGKGHSNAAAQEKAASLLSQVVQQQQRMQEALAKLATPKPTGATDQADAPGEKDGDAEGEPDVVEKMKVLQGEVEKLRSVLGDSDPAVVSRQKQIDELAKQRPLASQMLYTQRKLRKLEKKEQELGDTIRANEQQ